MHNAKRAAIALGSNLGNRVQNLRSACGKLLELYRGKIEIESLSRLYESAPQYVTEQPAFLNAAAIVRTTLAPLDLLRALKHVEKQLGREFGTKQIRWGPRPIDLDIVFYEEETVLEGEILVIPHPRWQERDFVKAPMADLLQPSKADQATGLNKNLHIAKKLWESQGGESAVRKYSMNKSLQCVLPVGNGNVWAWSNQTHVMGILNATPDSFSDGGINLNAKAAVDSAAQMVADGADIIDIGGQSTRPGAEVLEPGQEWNRVKPVLEAMQGDERFDGIPISIDTFYSLVAEHAVAAGATMVNDISGGKGDSAMFDAVADLGVPYIMMHIRGDPRTMHDRTLQVYDNICKEVGHSLSESCKEASLAGIEPWRLVLDPGIGFSKSTDGNLNLISGIHKMRKAMESPFQNLPILIGPSRKKFLGDVTGRESPLDREWATCAISAISAFQGGNIIRAHNIKAVKDAVKVADSISSRLQ
eukprot:jgi/Picsp_1/2917/NSC_01142-R1_dihydropterin pyrophosphokinase dihydropteroate synthase